MRKRLIGVAAAALAVLSAATAIGVAADLPTVVRVGNLVLEVDGGITPKALPARERVPIGFEASGDLSTLDGTHPPAVRTGIFDIDRDIDIDVAGIPTCRRAQLVARSSSDALGACSEALLGRGRASVEVAFPEQQPLTANGPLLLFNGGERGGVTTFYVHTYVSIPAPTAVVITARARRQNDGPYGVRIEATTPRIAGGAGSLTSFVLSANRYAAGAPDRRGFVYARCSKGHLGARGALSFEDGTEMRAEIIRTCEKAD